MSRSPEVTTAESFAFVFREAKDILKITFAEAGARVGVSKKTFETWLVRPPNVHRRRAIVDAFPDLPADLRRRLAASLGVPLPQPAVQEKSPPDPGALKAALEAALFEAAETLDAPARNVRKAIAVLLIRVADLGIDARTASTVIEPPRAEVEASSSTR